MLYIQVVPKFTDRIAIIREDQGEEAAVAEEAAAASRQQQWLKRGRDGKQKLAATQNSAVGFLNLKYNTQ